jgi:ankyrin repeat protein
VGAKVNVRTAALYEEKSQSPLLLAARAGHLDAVRVLVDGGADVNAHSLVGNTPLGEAIKGRNREMFDYLYTHGARAEVKDFNLAVGTGDVALVKWFLEHGFQIDQEEYEVGRSQLSHAIAREHLELVKFLVEHGANVNRIGIDYLETPLAQAARQEKLEIGKYLLQKGADPNLASPHKVFPLNYVARRGNLEFAELLLLSGAQVDSVDFEDMTPLEWAVENKDKAMVSLLLKHAAKVPKKLVPTIVRRFKKDILKGATIK